MMLFLVFSERFFVWFCQAMGKTSLSDPRFGPDIAQHNHEFRSIERDRLNLFHRKQRYPKTERFITCGCCVVDERRFVVPLRGKR